MVKWFAPPRQNSRGDARLCELDGWPLGCRIRFGFVDELHALVAIAAYEPHLRLDPMVVVGSELLGSRAKIVVDGRPRWPLRKKKIP